MLKVIVACIINMFAVYSVFMTQSIFHEIAESFHIPLDQARYSFSVVSLAYAASFFILGPIADKFNLPKMAVSGLVILMLSAAGASYAGGYDAFIAAMGCMGFGAALIPASMFPHVVKIAPRETAGFYMGSIVASGTLGVIVGRVAMGLMTEAMGWRLSFRLMGALFLVFAALTFLVLVEKKPVKEHNGRGLLELYTNSIRLMLSSKVLPLLLVGFSLFVGFLGMVTFLTYRLLEPPFNFNSGQIGWISFAGITSLVAPFAGSFSQRVGILKVLFPGLLACLLSLQLMGWLPSLTLIIIGLLLLFLSVYSCQPLVFIFISQSVPRDSIGSASSLYILFCIGGGSLSSIFMGPVWQEHGWHGITIACSLALLASLLIMSFVSVRGTIKT